MINIIYVFILIVIIILIYCKYKTKEYSLDLYKEVLLKKNNLNESNDDYNINNINNVNKTEYSENNIKKNEDNYYKMYVTFYYSTKCEKCKLMLIEWKKLLNELEKYKNDKTYFNIKFEFDIIVDDEREKHCVISKYCNLINTSFSDYNGSDNYKNYYLYINELYNDHTIYMNKII